jgi:hypothetical protein
VDLPEALQRFRDMHARASNRQEAIQRYCCLELEKRGLDGVEIEVRMPGFYRDKAWDVGLMVDGEPRLGISCKSIISNHGGTVPNRVDDMLGEAVSLHRAYPKAVLGYLFMMSRRDESKKTQERTQKLGGLTDARRRELQQDAEKWFEKLVESVTTATSRRSPDDWLEKFEAVSCSQIDFHVTPFGVVVHRGALSPEAMFDRLVAIYRERFG